ncbi:hypothetical protein EDB89DRAFT_2070648 [Lactarius sanguifluus]|nr:hypothetical protein EDB89DRAFT_2070648 [Lactarius sanguifluus]
MPTVKTTLQLLTLMFASRVVSLDTCLLLHLYLPTILLLLPVFLLLLSDADPTKTQYMHSPTRGIRRLIYYPGSHVHSSGWGWNSWGAGFLLPDLTPNRANGHGYW